MYLIIILLILNLFLNYTYANYGMMGGYGKSPPVHYYQQQGQQPPPQQPQIPPLYYAPDITSPIPLHIQRRIMRFCTNKNPEHPNCRAHPEWILPKGSIPLNSFNSDDNNDEFPEILNFQLPPVPNNYHDSTRSVEVPNDLLKSINSFNQNKDETNKIQQTLISVCAQTRNCMTQKPEAINQRADIAEQEVAILRGLEPDKPLDQIDYEVELRLARSFQVKQSLVQLGGLDKYLVPSNNGIYQEDILLSEDQSNSMINQIQNLIHGDNIGFRRKRAGNSVYFEGVPALRWPRDEPVKYAFHPTITLDIDKQTIRSALNEISSKVNCIKFEEIEYTGTPGSRIIYIKAAIPGFCGQGAVGRQDIANPVYLSFACPNSIGIAIHETLHALGLQHEQMRIDRDRYINIDYNNLDPKNYAEFAIADKNKFTSYGIKYDYGSIMHYSSTSGTRNFGQKTMRAKINPAINDPLMGQRNGLALSDISELHRMYCAQETCADSNVYCGVWAVQNFCSTWNQGSRNWMNENCPKSCGLCTE